MTRLPLAAAGLALLALAAAPDPLADMRWRHRVILVFADRADDQGLLAQRAAFAPVADGLHARDMRVLEVVGRTAPPGLDAAAARARFASASGFAVVLIGKDGGAKRRWNAPVTPGDLFAVVDAMPMARAEAARQNAD